MNAGYNNERLKLERDERARNLQAREEGELVGRVKLLQSLNGDAPTTTEELLDLGPERLEALERELQQRLRERLG
jgi:hypothetical protein